MRRGNSCRTMIGRRASDDSYVVAVSMNMPELWNVLRGDMSLVGPRPLLEEYLRALYTRTISPATTFDRGSPGGHRSTAALISKWEEKLAYDIWYVEHESFWLDLKIIIATIGFVLGWRGTYTTHHGVPPTLQEPLIPSAVPSRQETDHDVQRYDYRSRAAQHTRRGKLAETAQSTRHQLNHLVNRRCGCCTPSPFRSPLNFFRGQIGYLPFARVRCASGHFARRRGGNLARQRESLTVHEVPMNRESHHRSRTWSHSGRWSKSSAGAAGYRSFAHPQGGVARHACSAPDLHSRCDAFNFWLAADDQPRAEAALAQYDDASFLPTGKPRLVR